MDYQTLKAKLVSKGVELTPNEWRAAYNHYKQNLAEPGDCKGDNNLLFGLAVAESQVCKGPGWLPATQVKGHEYALILDNS